MNTIALIIRIMIVIFAAEGVVMFALSGVEFPGIIYAAMVDALALVLLSSPFIYLWVVRPYIKSRDKIDRKLKRVSDCLETKIEERTSSLRASEEIFHSVIETAMDAIIAIDKNGKVTLFNTAAKNMFGYETDEVIGKDIGELVVPEKVREKHNSGLKRFVDTGEGKLIGNLVEVEAMKSDGTIFPVELLLSRIDGGTGSVCTAIIRDITKRREAHLQLRQAQKAESLGTLAGGITHELNNLLLPILTLSRMVIKKLPDDSPEREKMEKIIEAGERAKDLVARVLAFSRLEEPHRENTEIFGIVDNALKLLKTTTPSSIKIVSDDMKKDTGKIFADVDQVATVLTNLVSNAVDAIGGKNGTIKISLTPVKVDDKLADTIDGLKAGTYAKLTVSDSGCGIDKDQLERIFDPFYTTKEVGQGTGLGLSMVQGTIARHKGGINVSSEAGKGTTFNIYLPLSGEDK